MYLLHSQMETVARLPNSIFHEIYHFLQLAEKNLKQIYSLF